MSRALTILLLVLTTTTGFCDEVEPKIYKMVQEYVFTEFGEHGVQAILPIPKSYMKTLEGKDFDEVKCRLKGKSNLYLYLDCDFMFKGQKVSSFPITTRIREGSKVAVEKNQKVAIVYVSKNLRISILGVALQNGKIGDYIEVKNLSTGKVLKGKVVSEGEVLIEQRGEIE